MSDAVTDTFTDADGTTIDAHIGEIGAVWSVNTHYGPGAADEFKIRSNSLSRAVFPDSDCTGEALIYPSGTLPGGTTDFIIEFEVVWDIDADGSYIAITEASLDSNGGGRPWPLALSNTSYWDAAHGIYYEMGAGGLGVGYNYATFTPVVGQTYLVQLVITGSTAVALKIDGVTVASWTRTAIPVEPFGINMYDNSGTGEMRIPSYRVYPVGGPGAFWTDNVLTTEDDA